MPTHGKIEGCLDGSDAVDCVYIPDENFNGEDIVKWTEVGRNTTKRENIATIKVIVNPVNDAPKSGKGQVLNLEEDRSIDFNVNKATDIDGDDFEYVITQNPKNGKIKECFVGDNLRCTYIPNKDFFGEDSFQYKVVDNNNLSSEEESVAFIIKGINDAPVVKSLDTIKVKEDTSIKINVPVAFDAENGNLFYEIVEEAKNGKINCMNGNGISCDYTPNKDFFGEDSFTYRVRDEQGLYSEIERVYIKVENLNDLPTARNIVLTKNAGETFFVTLLANDVDSSSVVFKIFKEKLKGLLENCIQEGMSYRCEYTSDVYFQGNDEFSYVVSDGAGDSEEYKVRLEILQAVDSDYDLVPDIVEKSNGTDPYSGKLLSFKVVPEFAKVSFRKKDNKYIEVKDTSSKDEESYLNNKINNFVYKVLSNKEVSEDEKIDVEDGNTFYLGKWSFLDAKISSEKMEKVKDSDLQDSSGSLGAKYSVYIPENEAVLSILNPTAKGSFVKDFRKENIYSSSVIGEEGTYSELKLDQAKEVRGLILSKNTISASFIKNKVFAKNNIIVSLDKMTMNLKSGRKLEYSDYIKKMRENAAQVLIKTDGVVEAFYVTPNKKLSEFLSENLYDLKLGADERVIEANGLKNEISLPLNWDNIQDHSLDKHFWYSSKDEYLKAGSTYIVGYFTVEEIASQTIGEINIFKGEVRDAADISFQLKKGDKVIVSVSDFKEYTPQFNSRVLKVKTWLQSCWPSECKRPEDGVYHYYHCSANYIENTPDLITNTSVERSSNIKLGVNDIKFDDLYEDKFVYSGELDRSYIAFTTEDFENRQLDKVLVYQDEKSMKEIGFIKYSENISPTNPRGKCIDPKWNPMIVTPTEPHDKERRLVNQSKRRSYNVNISVVGISR
jgi:hypothetical protein